MKIFYQTLLFVAILTMTSSFAFATGGGISGQSQAGCGGVGCHGTTASPATTVSISGVSGSVTVPAGTQRPFVALVAHASLPMAGVDISVKNGAGVNVGEFTAGAGLKLMNGELTQDGAQAITGTPRRAQFSFVWTAPDQPGTYTLRVAGIAINNNLLADAPDAWSVMTAITIVVPGITVTSPNGNEQWCRQSTKNITWTSSGVSFVDIWLSQDGGSSYGPLATHIPASPSSWSWAIPNSLTVNGGNLIKISDNASGSTFDVSNANFFILSFPEITQNPVNETACVGETKTFTVATDNPTAYNYAWQRNNSSIPGANSATYTIQSVTAASAGTYRCKVSGCTTDIYSDTATLIVYPGPSITSNPRDTMICPGSSAELRATATGEEISYQWRRNGIPLNNGNSSTYTISSATDLDSGAYDVVVTGRCAPPATSSIAKVRFPSPPQFFTQPTDTFTCSGTELKMKVEASGIGVKYTWKLNGKNISGAIGNSYTIASLSAADTGIVTVTATNSCDFSTTISAHIQIAITPSITVQPKDTITTPGSSVSFKITAKGSSLTYQWKRNGNNIPTGTSATLVLNPVKPLDSGIYTCTIKNSCGEVTSSAAKLTVNGSSAPSVGFNAQIIDLGCVLIGTTKDTTLKGVIENIGGSPLIVTDVSISGSGSSAFSILSGGGGFTLAPNDKRTITIRFSSTEPGGKLATLNVASNSITTPTPIALMAQGCLSRISVSKVVFDTTSPGITRDSVIQVCNNTTAAFAVTSAQIIGGSGQFEIASSDAMPKTLQPAGCMTFTIRYKPTSKNGASAVLAVKAGTTGGEEEHPVILEGKSFNSSGVDEDDALGKVLSTVRAYPNPSSDNVSFEINANIPEIVSLAIVDVEGRIVYRKANIQLDQGINNLHWTGNTLMGSRAANGSYTAIITAALGSRSTQFMIVR